MTEGTLNWIYEQEYRIILNHDDDVDEILLSKEMFDKGVVKYQKEDLEGIVFGMRINYENAKLVYDAVKKNYIDKGIEVNLYEAKEVPRSYEVKIEKIRDIDTYFDHVLKTEKKKRK